MHQRSVSLILILVAGLLLAAPAGVLAAKPTMERGSFTETFPDDFILDLCGIETMTTWTQHWSVKTFADGSEQVHVNRTFVSDDPRLPIEKGAGATFVSPDGVRTVVDKPIQLIRRGGGVILLDAGRITFGNELEIHGPHPSLFVDLADYYCP